MDGMTNIQKLCDDITADIGEKVKKTVENAIRESVMESLNSLAVEGEFYRNVNQELISGLKGIYREISDGPTNTDNPEETSKLFKDTSVRLEEIMETTRNATNTIMTSVEKLFEIHEETSAIIATMEPEQNNEQALAQLDSLVISQEALLTEIITACSFEDLTGQRLKRIMSAVSSIRETVFELYVASGLMIKGKQENPEKDSHTIVKESRLTAEKLTDSELKGPSKDSASQDDVDDLLASLGL